MTVLTYTSTHGLAWQLELRAARLVERTGVSHLPQPIGNITFHQIANPAQYGLPTQHPLQQQYPNLVMVQYFMVIEDRFLVERDGVRGVALYADYNGSGISASITSENGRNPLAPWDWEGKPGTLTDPSAQPSLEWRGIEVGGKTYPWFSGMFHGWPGWDGSEHGYDWRDGIPESVTTMYVRGQGRVGQSIMVPYEAPGLGVAEQTMVPDEVKRTYNILLYFPVPEAAGKASKLENIWMPEYSPYRGGTRGFEDVPKGGGLFLGMVRGAMRGGFESSIMPAVEPEFKMAVGGWIPQHIIKNPFSPFFWSEYPEALLVCWPISHLKAEQLLAPTLGGRRRSF